MSERNNPLETKLKGRMGQGSKRERVRGDGANGDQAERRADEENNTSTNKERMRSFFWFVWWYDRCMRSAQCQSDMFLTLGSVALLSVFVTLME